MLQKNISRFLLPFKTICKAGLWRRQKRGHSLIQFQENSLEPIFLHDKNEINIDYVVFHKNLIISYEDIATSIVKKDFPSDEEFKVHHAESDPIESPTSASRTALRIVTHFLENNGIDANIIISALIIESEIGRLILSKRGGDKQKRETDVKVYYIIYHCKIIPLQ